MIITEKDIGRIAITRSGRQVVITETMNDLRYNIIGVEQVSNATYCWTSQGEFHIPFGKHHLDLVTWDNEDEIKQIAFKMYCDYLENVIHQPTVLKSADEFMNSSNNFNTREVYLSAARTALEGGMEVPKSPVDVVIKEIRNKTLPDIATYIVENYERKQ